MGSLFGGGSKTTTTNQTVAPWSPQQPFLMTGLQNAQSTYDKVNSIGPYTGNFVAPGNSIQTGAIDQAAGWNTGNGAALPNTTAGTASTLQSTAPAFVNNASNLAANGSVTMDPGLFGRVAAIANSGGTSAPLSEALNNAAVAGANNITGFQHSLQDVVNTGLSDPTQRISADAGAYASAPAVQGAIDATNARIDQTLNESTIPGLNREAAMGGTLNSSRAGAAEAQAAEGAAIAKGIADSSITNNAYNSGLSTAGGLYSSGLNTANWAAGSGAGSANSSAIGTAGVDNATSGLQLSAAASGLNSNLNYGQANASTRLSANGQLGTAAGLGINGATSAELQAGQNLNTGATAGAQQHALDQIPLTNSLDQWNMNTTFPWQNLDNYWNIVGKPLGSQGTATQKTTDSGPGVLGGILGTASSLGGLFGNNGAFPGVGNAIGSLLSSGGSAAAGASGAADLFSTVGNTAMMVL